MLNKIIFLDSAAFLNASLADSVKTLRESGHEFKLLEQWRGLKNNRGDYVVKEETAPPNVLSPLSGKTQDDLRFKREELEETRRAKEIPGTFKDYEARVVWGLRSDRNKVHILDAAEEEQEVGQGSTSSWWQPASEEKREARLELLRGKQIFPYDYVRSARQLYSETTLPPRESFYNRLTQEECSEKDYLHAQSVWNTFNCETMLDYNILYNCSDVFLLAECLVDMRNRVFDTFGLDLTLFFSFPHLAKQIMLRYTQAEPEYISDYAMAHLVRSNIRGGLTFINQRLIKLHEKVDEQGRAHTYLDKEGKHPACIVYLDEVSICYILLSFFSLSLSLFRLISE